MQTGLSGPKRLTRVLSASFCVEESGLRVPDIKFTGSIPQRGHEMLASMVLPWQIA